MHKRVLLLAVSCKTGGLCPGGIDLDNPSQWIRIVRDDGRAGAVQGFEIDFAQPLDIIEFDGRPMPQGKQQENWVIDNRSCRKTGRRSADVLGQVYNQYGYHGFWGNYRTSLNEAEFAVTAPSESIMEVTNVRIYQNEKGKAKIDFQWGGSLFPIKWVSLTDQDYYPRIKNGEVITIERTYIVVSIPKEIDDYTNPHTGEKQAFKFVSKVFPR